jgi:hypothetical protein
MTKKRVIVVASRRGLAAIGILRLQRIAEELILPGPELIVWAAHFTAARAEVGTALRLARACSTTSVIGLGGGRAIDVARAAASRLSARFITVPTIAGTCTAATGWCTIGGRSYDARKHPDAMSLEIPLLQRTPLPYLKNGICEALLIFLTSLGSPALGRHARSRAASDLELLLTEVAAWRHPRRGAKRAGHRGKTPSEALVRSLICDAARSFEEVGLGPGHSLFIALRSDREFGPRLRRDWMAYCARFQCVLLGRPREEMAAVTRISALLDVPWLIGLERTPPHRRSEIARRVRVALASSPFPKPAEHILDAIEATNATSLSF